MKKRTLTISLIVLAIMLLVGIGYAGWVIARSDSGVADGNFTAYSVSDSGALDVQNTSNNSVVFGYAGTPSNPWLTYTTTGEGAVAAEDLEAEFTVSWSGGAATFNCTHSFYTGTLADPATPEVSPLLIGGPTYSIKQTNAVNGATISEAGVLSFTDQYVAYTEVTITVTYKFGTLFNEDNPYTFFNGKGVNEAAFDGGNYKGYTTSNIALSTINSTLGSSLVATSTYADVANVALSELYDLVGNGTLKFKVEVAKA